MSDFDNTNRGALFKNHKKEGKQPDYRGVINVDGVDKEIAGWLKQSKKGETFMSLSVSEPFKKQEPAIRPEEKQNFADQSGVVGNDLDDDLPFFDDDVPF